MPLNLQVQSLANLVSHCHGCSADSQLRNRQRMAYIIQVLYWHNGKENENYYLGSRVWGRLTLCAMLLQAASFRTIHTGMPSTTCMGPTCNRKCNCLLSRPNSLNCQKKVTSHISQSQRTLSAARRGSPTLRHLQVDL